MAIAAALAVLLPACGANSPLRVPEDGASWPRNDVPAPIDVFVDAPADNIVGERCTADTQCDNGRFCDGAERCAGGVCVPGPAPCASRPGCAVVTCDEGTRMCSTVNDHARCDDGNACNGTERCNPRAMGADPMSGCVPGGALDCNDGNNCTTDTCHPMAGCQHAPRDLDGDGHVDRACMGDDCNDADPNSFPGAMEICNDGRDNDCNTLVDSADPACRVMPRPGDTCAMPTVLPGPGTYRGTTRGMADDFMPSCFPGSAADTVFSFTITTPQDVTLSLVAAGMTFPVMALASTCSPFREMGCAAPSGGPGVPLMLRRRNLAPGTYFVVVDGNSGAGSFDFGLTLQLTPPTPGTVNYVLGESAAPPFVDACTSPSGGAFLRRVDDQVVTLPPGAVPFPIRVYNNSITTAVSVSSNGFIHFDSATGFAPLSGMVPNPMAPNLVVAAYWTDLYTRDRGVCYATTGLAPNRRFIVQWDDLHFCCTDDPAVHMTFQIVIDEAPAGMNNTFEVIYQDMRTGSMMSRPGGAGIENEDGSLGTTIPTPTMFPPARRVTLTPVVM